MVFTSPEQPNLMSVIKREGRLYIGLFYKLYLQADKAVVFSKRHYSKINCQDMGVVH